MTKKTIKRAQRMLDWFYRLQPAPNLQPDWSNYSNSI
jgi:hypothetical protein